MSLKREGRFARATSLNMGKEWSQSTRQGDSGSCKSKDSVGMPRREGEADKPRGRGRGWQHMGGSCFLCDIRSWDRVGGCWRPRKREGMKHRMTATMKTHIYVCVAVSLPTYQPPLPLWSLERSKSEGDVRLYLNTCFMRGSCFLLCICFPKHIQWVWINFTVKI